MLGRTAARESAPCLRWGVLRKEQFMSKKLWIAIAPTVVLIAAAIIVPCLRGGEVTSTFRYQVLDPIRHGNLTIFPVVSSASHDTHSFLTLDEGLRSGEVVVSEAGSLS